LLWAADERCVVLTCDLDFGAILAATQRGNPSVVQIRSDQLLPDAIGPSIVAALRHCATELEAGALLSIDTVRLRLQLLPLPSILT
jgi:predicted nuclease of predicted toxin-antitoxin system